MVKLEDNLYKIFSNENYTSLVDNFAYPFVDIFTVSNVPISDTEKVVSMPQGLHPATKYSNVFPLRYGTFMGLQLKIPNDVRGTLRSYFGFEAFSKCKSTRYNHKTSQGIDDQYVSVDCKLVSHLFNRTIKS